MGRAIVVLSITALSLALGAWLVYRRPAFVRRALPARASSEPAAKLGSPPPPAPRSLAPSDGGAPQPVGRDGGGPLIPTNPLSEALCPPDTVLIDSEGPLRRFCIDRFEYPNLGGVVPATMVTFEQALDACREEGKRLCTEPEWIEACAAGGSSPTPADCNTAAGPVHLAPEALWDPLGVSQALESVDGRTASGARKRCVTPDGVYDMVGNVAEWVKPPGAGPYRSVLRGGHFADGASSCRWAKNLTAAHYRFFQTGFRCCCDALVAAPERRKALLDEPPSGRLP